LRLWRLLPKWNVPKWQRFGYCKGLVCTELADLDSGHGRGSPVCLHCTLGYHRLLSSQQAKESGFTATGHAAAELYIVSIYGTICCWRTLE